MEETNNLQISNSVDRISNLPESLIHHILSFLDMKYVVQTSFLSRKWRYNWTSVDTLLFDSYVFYQGVEVESEDEDEDRNSFGIFVDRVLMLRGGSDIKKFHLDQDRDSQILRGDLVSRWILALVRRNVQELSITMPDNVEEVLRLPHCLVTSELLTGLVLDTYCTVVLPDSISLPRLKSLSLSFEIGDVKFLNNLLASCPVLQTLVIKLLGVLAGNELSVNSRELKHLEIGYIFYRGEVPGIIKLYTPSLTSFICADYMAHDYCLENLSSLVTADIKMEKQFGDRDEELFRKRMMVFLMAFHNVKQLKLSPEFLQVLSGAPNLVECQLREFRNLQCLKLEMCFDGYFLRGLTSLLTILPCLESLFITSKEPDSENSAEAVLSGSCVLAHLKFIEVREVRGCDNELILLEYVLKNATVLEEMVLYFCSGGSSTSLNTRKEFSKKIKAFPRASSSLIMRFT